MLQNFRCKNAKDIETAAETLIYNSGSAPSLQNTGKTVPKLTVTFQQQNTESYDNYIEKKK